MGCFKTLPQTPAKPWRKNEILCQQYTGFCRHVRMFCTKVDSVFAFNEKFYSVLEAQEELILFMEVDVKERKAEQDAIPTWKWPCSYASGNIHGFICVLLANLFVCRIALTRSLKSTSLVVKEQSALSHSHQVTVPVVNCEHLGNTKLRHQLPGSHCVGQGRTQPNWITLSQSHVRTCVFADTHNYWDTHTETLAWKTISDPSQWHPFLTGYSNHRLPPILPFGEMHKCGRGLTHSHFHMTVKSASLCSQFMLSAFFKRHGHGW